MKLDSLCNSTMKSNSRVSSKLSEVRGLYTAYEVAPNDIVLEKILEGLIEVIELQSTTMCSKVEETPRKRVNLTGDLLEFYNYLVDAGKAHTTADNYRKIVIRIVKDKFKDIADLNNHIKDAIAIYDGNDADYHNMHVAALRQYEKFLNSQN